MLIFTNPPPPLEKCMACTLMKMLAFIDGPLYSALSAIFKSALQWLKTLKTKNLTTCWHQIH